MLCFVFRGAGRGEQQEAQYHCVYSPAGTFAEGAAEPASVVVDTSAVGHAVNPLVFGVNGEVGTITVSPNVKYPIYRWGGNEISAYNWWLDAGNQGNDWFFVSEPWGTEDGSQLPLGGAGDLWAESLLSFEIQGMLSIPTMPFVSCEWPDLVGPWGRFGTPKVGCYRNKCSSFSVHKYGPQTGSECTGSNNAPWCDADCGNGILQSNGSYVDNDPKDAYMPNSPAFQVAWLAHLKKVAPGAVTRVSLGGYSGETPPPTAHPNSPCDLHALVPLSPYKR